MANQLNFLEKIQHYIFNNLLSVIWTTSLLVGGFIFWLYFSGIQYFPDLNFDESVLLLVVAAITGIFFLLFLALPLMSPYFFRWLMLLEQQKPSPPSDREKASDIERIWYFGSIFLVFFALLLYFYLEHEFKTSCLSYGIPILIVLVIFLEHMQVYFSLFDWIERKPQCIKKKVFCKSDEENDKQEPKDINMFWAWLLSLFFFILLVVFQCDTA